MFDLSDPQTTRLISADGTAGEPTTPEDIKGHDLDSEAYELLQKLLIGYYRQELDRQMENRMQMAVDEDYYDNIQWTEEEAQILKDRGQAPMVYNVTKTAIDWVIGTEKRGRTDYDILPRNKNDAKPAEIKSQFLKYLSDVNRTPFHRSRAFEDQVKVGIGFMEDGVQDEDDGEPIYSRYESWRNMLWDSAATEIDFSDGRYMFRMKFIDVDIAKSFFPDRAAAIDAAADGMTRYGTGGEWDGDDPSDYAEMKLSESGYANNDNTHMRDRVRLIECWYKIPKKVERIKGGTFNGEIFDKDDSRHTDEVDSGAALVASKVMMVTRVALMTTEAMLYEGESPYRHNRFPFTPYWGYRRGRDGLPYGIIRTVRDIQDGVNKAASKFRHILSSNKVIKEEGALPEGMTEEEFAEEVARPDAIITIRKGYKLELNVDRDLAEPYMQMFSRDLDMIQQVSGVTDENMGKKTNAVSGVAIQARQEQGSIVTNKLFDNLRLGVQMQGEIQLSLIEQFTTEAKTFRITDQRGNPDFVQMNSGLPEDDITRSKADFVISETDWRASNRQTQLDMLAELLAKMPEQIAMSVLDLMVDAMDIPNRDEIVKRIRQITGQKDPDQTEPTPEDIASQQAAAKQQQFTDAMNQAALDEAQGKATKVHADAIKSGFDANKSSAQADMAAAQTELVKAETINQKILATSGAMVAAQGILLMPASAKVGDELLDQAGWQTFVPPDVQAQQKAAQTQQALQGIQQQPAQQQPANAMPPNTGAPPAPPPMPQAPPAPNGMIDPNQPAQ